MGNLSKSIRIKIEDIISSDSDKIMNKLTHIYNTDGISFRLRLWHDTITKSELDEFTGIYSNIIDSVSSIEDLNSQSYEYFIIESSYDPCVGWKFKYYGDIIDGINKYIDILNRVNRVENENRNSRQSRLRK